MSHPKRIGFLSFGAWHPTGGTTNSAGDTGIAPAIGWAPKTAARS